MGRPAKFQRKEIAGAALRLVSDRGPGALTVAALAKELGAPTGSIYHRYASRDQLLAELWMDVVEGFQTGFIECLEKADDIDGAIAAAQFMGSWVREHVTEARLLLLHRRQDFVAGKWPPALVARADALEPELGTALRAFAHRAFGGSNDDVMARLRFALLDAPLGGIKPFVQSRKPVPGIVDSLISATARAVLSGIASPAPGGQLHEP